MPGRRHLLGVGMLLTITTTHRTATDLEFLLHKHPDRFQSFDLSFGRTHVFYPEAADERCVACLMLDVDPVGRLLEGYDAAAVVEAVEHLDPPRLSAFERVLFELARPRAIVLTTPNREC